MAIRMTFHGASTKDDEGFLDGQLGEAIIVADGTASDPLERTGFYRLVATSACVVRAGADLTDAAGGEYWPQGTIETRRFIKGQIVAVDAS